MLVGLHQAIANAVATCVCVDDDLLQVRSQARCVQQARHSEQGIARYSAVLLCNKEHIGLLVPVAKHVIERDKKLVTPDRFAPSLILDGEGEKRRSVFYSPSPNSDSHD